MESWPDSPEKRLVQRTRAHLRYTECYHHLAPLANKSENGWYYRGSVSLAPGKPVKLLSLDCEMAEVEGGGEEIVQLCAVDRSCKKLLDIIVKPSQRVVDYRTYVHGIEAREIEESEVSQKDAQEMVIELLTPETILVGHTLSHDLEVLKIDYPAVIDVALIYKIERNIILSLNDLCKVVLGSSLRADASHNCFEDAVAPMKIVLQELKTPTLKLDLTEVDQKKLFIHGIPTNVNADELSNLFASKCNVRQVRRKETGKGTCIIEFDSKLAADSAFNYLRGNRSMDRNGYDQKKVFVKGSSDVLIRKMVQDSERSSTRFSYV